MIQPTASMVMSLIHKRTAAYIVALITVLLLAGCGVFTDAATRLAYDLEHAAKQLRNDGDRFTLYHETPSRRGECDGPYVVQLDKVGALVIWCKNESGEVLASPGTSYHRRFVRTSETFYLEKRAKETLIIELQKHGSEAVIVDAY